MDGPQGHQQKLTQKPLGKPSRALLLRQALQACSP